MKIYLNRIFSVDDIDLEMNSQVFFTLKTLEFFTNFCHLFKKYPIKNARLLDGTIVDGLKNFEQLSNIFKHNRWRHCIFFNI